MNKLQAERVAERLRYQRWIDTLLSSALDHEACDLKSQWRASRSRALMTLSAIALRHRWAVNGAQTAKSDDILTP